MPTKEDIGLAYASYYTHGGFETESRRRAWLEALFRGPYNLLLRLTGISRAMRRLKSMYLDATSPGRLLDVGCGDGWLLAKMAGMGWHVEGQEVDREAATRARSRFGFTVHTGPLEALELPEATYDAIIMNHAIEHVHDPIRVVSECHRLLKDGGQLIVVTPNIDSLGHRLFGSSWRGLEPPRHLHVFSDRTLRWLAEISPFREAAVWTVSATAGFIAIDSFAIRGQPLGQDGATRTGIRSLVLSGCVQALASVVHLVDRSSGDECVLRAVK